MIQTQNHSFSLLPILDFLLLSDLLVFLGQGSRPKRDTNSKDLAGPPLPSAFTGTAGLLGPESSNFCHQFSKENRHPPAQQLFSPGSHWTTGSFGEAQRSWWSFRKSRAGREATWNSRLTCLGATFFGEAERTCFNPRRSQESSLLAGQVLLLAGQVLQGPIVQGLEKTHQQFNQNTPQSLGILGFN